MAATLPGAQAYLQMALNPGNEPRSVGQVRCKGLQGEGGPDLPECGTGGLDQGLCSSRHGIAHWLARLCWLSTSQSAARMLCCLLALDLAARVFGARRMPSADGGTCSFSYFASSFPSRRFPVVLVSGRPTQLSLSRSYLWKCRRLLQQRSNGIRLIRSDGHPLAQITPWVQACRSLSGDLLACRAQQTANGRC
jgi:hypothetical protein